ncbi:MAG: hypothetical protein OHK0022_19940 [Roseiflexaceae bacterium]
MGMPAVAAYLQALREWCGLSRTELARRADLNTMVVWRLEVKHGSVQASLLAMLAAVLQADIRTIHQLLLEPTATPEEEQHAAAAALGLATGAVDGPIDERTLLAELEPLVRVDRSFATLLRRVLRLWQIAQTKP